MNVFTRRRFLSAVGVATVGLIVQPEVRVLGQESSALLSADEAIDRWVEDKTQELQGSPLLVEAFKIPSANIRVEVTDEAKGLILDQVKSILEDQPICQEDFETVLALIVTHILDFILSRGITQMDGSLIDLSTSFPRIVINAERVRGLQNFITDCSLRPCWYKIWCKKCP